jgi:hypothetical protein
VRTPQPPGLEPDVRNERRKKSDEAGDEGRAGGLFGVRNERREQTLRSE